MHPSGRAAIIEQIGERGLLLPELIARGLAANNRLKYYVTLLQAAQAHARAPKEAAQNLRVQREASGVLETRLDRVVEESVDRGSNTLYIPGIAFILERMFDDLRCMLQPLLVADDARVDVRERVEVYRRRIDDLIAHLPPCPDDQMTTATIASLTRLSRNGHDTVHQLVVDLFGELNRLHAGVTMERIDGASAYNVTDPDRALIRAFMRGVNETAGLKFDHPGLETMATREGNRLSIENDLSSTTAHVIIVHVDALSITATYTDTHRSRIEFLHEMLQPYGGTWTESSSDAADFDVSVGVFGAADLDAVSRFLRFIGSRLVFLIDWNRARKRLLHLVKKGDATELLTWAAQNNIGHRAFLQCGDIQLVERACKRAQPLQKPLVGLLDEMIGHDAAMAFLRSVLRTTSSGLASGQSRTFIEDEIETELWRHLESSDRQLIQAAIEHASLMAALAERLHDGVQRLANGGDDTESTKANGTWTTRSDEIVGRGYRSLELGERDDQLRLLLTGARAAMDALDEVAFMLPLVPPAIDVKMLSLLGALSELVVAAVQQYIRDLEAAGEVLGGSPRADVDAFLIDVDRLSRLSRQANAARRAVVRQLLRGAGDGDCHELYVATTMADRLELTAMRLAHCGARLRDYVLRARLRR